MYHLNTKIFSVIANSPIKFSWGLRFQDLFQFLILDFFSFFTKLRLQIICVIHLWKTKTNKQNLLIHIYASLQQQLHLFLCFTSQLNFWRIWRVPSDSTSIPLPALIISVWFPSSTFTQTTSVNLINYCVSVSLPAYLSFIYLI